jgi:hypothetical protein
MSDPDNPELTQPWEPATPPQPPAGTTDDARPPATDDSEKTTVIPPRGPSSHEDTSTEDTTTVTPRRLPRRPGVARPAPAAGGPTPNPHDSTAVAPPGWLPASAQRAQPESRRYDAPLPPTASPHFSPPPPPGPPTGAPRYPGPAGPPGAGYGPHPGQFGPAGPYGPPYPLQRVRRPRTLAFILAGIAAAVALVLVLGFAWPGFFTSTELDVAAAQTGVAQVLSDNTNGFGATNVTDVACNGGHNPTVKKGGSFQCQVNIDGTPRHVTVIFQDDAGTYQVGQPQ